MSQHTTGHTGLLCLLGSPVAHSISPEMHNEACSLLGLDYQYLAFDVTPDRLETAVNGLRELGMLKIFKKYFVYSKHAHNIL